jgi:dipeptidyl aminopeptidase/acylaminoacyl peptidase
MLRYVQTYASQGFAVLAIDQAGHGASTGFRAGNSLQEDGVTAVRWLQQQPSVNASRIGIWGWSMGGGTVWQVAKVLGPSDGLISAGMVGTGVMFVLKSHRITLET